MDVTVESFREKTRRALGDERLQSALGRVTSRFQTGRAEAFAAYPEGDVLRDRARAIKAATIADLEHHLERLTAAVERRGGTVHRARDAAAARAVVVDIARRSNARLAVKSKSMTTEEIELNAALEAADVETVETDLGEYILQLAGETPSHIIAPAIHKTKEDVATLFTEKLGAPRHEHPEELTAEARRQLRDRFRRADLGITGVNFAVADTGTIAIVENEGNARLTTSLPRVHVAIMGMEKVIPDLQSLAVFLKILARSATGQKMSSYVSLVSGPRRDGEEDGPDKFHLVILDNGRSRLLADPELREALHCIRCGACLNACPVYRHAGGHAYGWVYSGPIGAVIDPTLLGYERAGELPFASSLCGACRDVCPVRIDLPRMLLVQRRRMLEAKPKAFPSLLAKLFTFVAASPARWRLAVRLVRLAAWPFTRRGAWRPPFARGWTRHRDLPPPAAETFQERFRRRRT